MIEDNHFKALENMYAAAPINKIYNPVMTVSEGRSEIFDVVKTKGSNVKVPLCITIGY